MKTAPKVIAKAALIAAFAFLAFASVAFSQDQPSRAQMASQRKTLALVVGISKYPKLPGGQQLQFAERDAALFAEAIKKTGVRPENIRVLIGAEATLTGIKAALGNWIARSATEEDTVIFFFSGHGLYENEFGDSYLLGYDSDAKDPFGSALSTNEINQALNKRVRSRRVLILADAMRKDFFDPDSIGSAAASFIRAFNQVATSGSGVSAILANGPGEFSREGQRWGGHGVFTRHIVDALSAVIDRNGDGFVTADELFDAAKAKIAEDTSNKQQVWRSETALAQVRLFDAQQPTSDSIARLEPARKTNGGETAPVKPAEPVAAVNRENPSVAPANQPTKSVARDDARAEKKSDSESKKTESSKEIEPRAPSAVESAQSKPATSKPATKPVAKASETPSTKPLGPEKDSQRAERPPSVAPEAAKKAETIAKAPERNVPERSAPAPATIRKETSTQPAPEQTVIASTRTVESASPSAPTRPELAPPSVNPIGAGTERNRPAPVSTSVPISSPASAPTPLILELEAALASKNLLEPKNRSAWDLYQRLATDPSAASDIARLKPALADALAESGRSIVSGDICSDNIADRVDDFRRAGQMLARARALRPDAAEIAALEKLSAAQALIALQFYDEAERTLTLLQNTKLAAVENALGLVYQGKLDQWRAERAFKRASELNDKWATPHYNLALFYRSQQNDAALEELERAAALDSTNPNIMIAMGDERFSKQQWQAAADAFRKAIALRPSDGGLHTKLGHALYSQGLQEEANREYQKARELRSKQP